ncbi:DUF5979 domain-containing protein [Microbacterium sp. BWT-B31]|uniref:DUF5979 domain-containing protein n=1 Tax=Microbacterium sp. BWT-B31 TaxID=3232072 RepID=UPI003529D007
MTAAVAAVGVVVVALVAAPTAAHAAPNPDIVVGGVSITPADRQAAVGDTLTVSGEWDATDADPHPGDTFTIGLPAEFAYVQAVPFALMGNDQNGDLAVWGNCLTDPATGTVTCELTDVVSALPEQVHGTWQLQVTAVAATAAEEVVFDLNGQPVLVGLPGEGGVDDGIDLPDEVSKSGVMNENNWSMTWTVDLPGATMAGQSTVTLHDVLGAGHQLCSPTGLKVETVRGSTVVDATDLVTTAPEPGATDFTIVLTAPEEGFDPDVTYRVTYPTCTIDGRIDPEGTTYENSVQVEGWGDAGVGTGQVENLPWHQSLTKYGSVLGEGARNGKIAWAVIVAGDQLLGKDGFTLTETLGAGHEVCPDTIAGIRVIERYGPSDQAQREITDLLTATTVSSTEQAFQVRFDIDDAEFEFKASDYRYVVFYVTCVSAEGLPAGGTEYANSVDVDGQVTTGRATVPDRVRGKTGGLNTSVVTIDGVQHMPQTTLDWGIAIPGEVIEGIDDHLVLTDTLSSSQAVCAAGDPAGTLAERLRLRVEARDQIQDGGLSPVDLTSVTDVKLDGDVLTFEIDATDLPIPTGMSDGFTREYQYIIRYTTCTASGGMDAPGTVYENAVSGTGIDYSTSIVQFNSGSGTGQGVARGSVSIEKLLADTPGAELVPDDAVFTVHVKEIDPTRTFQHEYDLEVPLQGPPARGLNARGTGWTVEITEPTFPSIPGVVFGAPVFAPSPGVTVSEDGATATAVIQPGVNVSVSLTNEALLGSISVVKALEGAAADLVDPARTYQVRARIDTSALGDEVPAQPDRLFDLTVGDPLLLEDLPIGSIVTFSETRPTDDDALTWAEPVFTPAEVVVTAAHATDPATVTVTNSASRTTGTFTLMKTVTGSQADNSAVPDAVTVTATWNQEGAEGSTTLTVPTDGTPVPFGENLLIGTEVTLTETPLADGNAIAWGAPVWSGTGVALDGRSAIVTIGRDADATVTLENHAATSTAGIALIKGIGGEAAGEVDARTQFPVTVSWIDPDGTMRSRELTINAVEPTPLGVELPAGTAVTITEGTRPGFDTVVWGSITITGVAVDDNGDGSATVIVSDQQDDVTLVTVINEATWAPGTFSLAKHIEGVRPGHAGVPDRVTVIASWVDEHGPQSVELQVPADGSAVEFPHQLPHGTEVTLSEIAPDGTPQFTWATPAWSGDSVAANDDGTATVRIGAAATARVELVNTAVPSVGSLTIIKSLTGDGATRSSATAFPVTLTWTDLQGDAQTRTVSLVAGTPVTIEDVPLGTQVQVEEHAGELADRIRWAAAGWSSEDENVKVSTEDGSAAAVVIVTAAAGTTAELALQNTLVIVPDLAITGADSAAAWTLGAAAFLSVLAGALLLRTRRRRA